MIHYTPKIKVWHELEEYLYERDKFHAHELALTDDGIICAEHGSIRLDLIKVEKVTWENFNWNDYPHELQVALEELSFDVIGFETLDFPNVILFRAEAEDIEGAIKKVKLYLRLLDYGWVFADYKYRHCIWGEKEWGEDCYSQDIKEQFEEFYSPAHALFQRLKNNESIPTNCNWDLLLEDSYYWGALLSKRPQLKNYCPLDKLDNNVWKNIFKYAPGFADKFDFSRLTPKLLEALLKRRPDLLKKCDYSILSNKNWTKILCVQPQLSEYCNFENFRSKDWATLLQHQASFAKKCNWKSFTSEDYETIFENIYVPKTLRNCNLLEFCDYLKFNAKTWSLVLSEYPNLAKHCHQWENFTPNNWETLLTKQIQFAEKCNWDKLPQNVAFNIIIAQGKLTNYYDCKKFNNRQKILLLRKYKINKF